MKGRKQILTVLMAALLAGTIWTPAVMTVHAEEGEPAGYHEYKTTEDEAIDHWYGITRGTYLREGICTVARAGTAKVSISGTTNAHCVCQELRATVYLDESENGSSFRSAGVYYYKAENTTSCHGSEGDIRVNKNWYYRGRGVHTVKQGSVTETIDTQTNAIKAY